MVLQQAIGSLAQIPKGEGRAFEVSGRRVAVLHTREGDVFALDAACPHRRPLSYGSCRMNSTKLTVANPFCWREPGSSPHHETLKGGDALARIMHDLAAKTSCRQ